MGGEEELSREEAVQWLDSACGSADVYVVALQEVLPLSIWNATGVRDSEAAARANGVAQTLLSALALRGETSVRLVSAPICLAGLALIVLVGARSDILPSAICTERVPTYLLSRAPKGGVALRLRLGGATACFVSVHLPSGSAPMRAAELRDATLASVLTQLGERFPSAPHEHDLLVVLGDCNYRLQERLDDASADRLDARMEGVDEASTSVAWRSRVVGTVLRAADDDGRAASSQASKQLANLLASHDELTRSLRDTSGALAPFGLREAPILFLPTYKMVKVAPDAAREGKASSGQVAPSPPLYQYDAKRVPSWTDRVLVRATPPGAVQTLAYKACFAVRASDHRPVALRLRWAVP